ncbi:MAG: hypothetical protein WA823_16435 [Candidatus Acidiferrales bacterium]
MHRDPNELLPDKNSAASTGRFSPDSVAGSNSEPLATPTPACPYRVMDVAAIVDRRRWLVDHTTVDNETSGTHSWFARALTLLGPQSPSLEHLESLLELVFHYDAAANLALPENRSVLVRTGAREVIRELANRILDGGGISDSNRFKEIVDGIKAAVPFRSRVIFHPLRLALAGRTGDGDLDRVILVLDPAAKLPFAVKVKDTRERMLEFCAALD